MIKRSGRPGHHGLSVLYLRPGGDILTAGFIICHQWYASLH